MIADFIYWAITLLTNAVSWLSSMQIVEGVSVLAFMAATFIFGVLIRALIPRG